MDAWICFGHVDGASSTQSASARRSDGTPRPSPRTSAASTARSRGRNETPDPPSTTRVPSTATRTTCSAICAARHSRVKHIRCGAYRTHTSRPADRIPASAHRGLMHATRINRYVACFTTLALLAATASCADDSEDVADAGAANAAATSTPAASTTFPASAGHGARPLRRRPTRSRRTLRTRHHARRRRTPRRRPSGRG